MAKLTVPADDNHPLKDYINPLFTENNWAGDQPGTAAAINYNIDSSDTVFVDAVHTALQAWSNVANISFTENPAEEGITFRLTDQYPVIPGSLGGTTKSYTWDHFIIYEAQVGLSSDFFTSSDFQSGQRGYHTLLHEIGHALGFAHPNIQYDNTSSINNGGSPYADAYPSSLQNYDYSIMNIPNPSFGPVTAQYGYASTPQFADIAAIQYLYGANHSYNAGDDTYDFATPQVMTLWDGGGNDTIDASAQNAGVRINLNEAAGDAHSTIGGSAFWIAHGANIENANGGAGTDTLIGNALNNTLRGLGANDDISGNAGHDWINGNQGNDTLTGGIGSDTLRGGQDQDTLTGNQGWDFANGNKGNDTVAGENGNDTLHGGQNEDILQGGDGNDLLFGDLGHDTLTGGSGADSFIFNALTSGIDTITDFQPGIDTLELRNSSYTSPSEVIAAFTGNTLDLLGGNTITLANGVVLTEGDVVLV